MGAGGGRLSGRAVPAPAHPRLLGWARIPWIKKRAEIKKKMPKVPTSKGGEKTGHFRQDQEHTVLLKHKFMRVNEGDQVNTKGRL